MKKQHGFSLIELLVVVAIILIIAAIAIPALLRAQQAAQKSAAVGDLRSINTATALYQQNYSNGYPPNLAVLSGPSTAASSCNASELLDNTWITTNAGVKDGFVFSLTPMGAALATAGPSCGTAGTANGFVINAIPQNTILPSFCTDENLTIRTFQGQTAMATDVLCDANPAIGN
jgi:prepilin-type N-terminal cleavage/methylation domain-containing protein